MAQEHVDVWTVEVNQDELGLSTSSSYEHPLSLPVRLTVLCVSLWTGSVSYHHGI